MAKTIGVAVIDDELPQVIDDELPSDGYLVVLHVADAEEAGAWMKAMTAGIRAFPPEAAKALAEDR